jgi:putative transposase
MKIIRGFKTEMKPNDRQRTLFLQHAGCARFAYNWGLERCIRARENGEKKPSAMELHRQLNAIKESEFPWMYESSKCAPQEALRNLDKAYENFFRNCKRKKRGKKGFPRFKSRSRGIGNFRLTGSIRASETHVTLPRIGAVRLKEHGYLPTSDDDVRVLSATVSEKAGRWFVSLQVEIESQDPPPPEDDDRPIVGVDLGIKQLATCSDGTTFENPRALESKLMKLRRLQRSLSRKERGSENRRKAARRVAKLHWRISNVRRNALHEVTTWLTENHSAVVIEDLNVSGMMKNRRLARAISDVGFHEFRRQLEYKGEWYGCEIIVADRFFPSSKTCSDCGAVNEALTLSDREWVCVGCGSIHDRDLNAAVNLKNWAPEAPSPSVRRRRETPDGGEGSGPCIRTGETGPDEAGIRHEVVSV